MTRDIVIRNHVTESGSGSRPMVFAHGFGCDQNMWRLVAPAFADTHSVVLFDYVGSGRSDVEAYDPRRYGTLDGYAQDIMDVVKALELRDVILVGHSVSAMIGVLAVRRAPDRFSDLIMIGPSPRYIDDPPDYVGGFSREDIEGLLETMEHNYIGWANFLAPVVMGNGDRPELAEELERSFCSTDPVIARRFAEVTFYGDNREDLPGVRVPVLVIQSADDAIAPVEVGEYVHAHLPDSTYRLIDTTGHCPHMSHPAETIAAIKDYLARG